MSILTKAVPATARALGFLTRAPVPQRFFREPVPSPAEDAWAFALAGALIGLPGAAILLTLAHNGPLAAGLALAATALLTGALHEDGLADTADGFWGGRDKARRLEIMKDSATGSYGLLALILCTGLQWAALAQLAGWRAALALIACHALSRALMVWHWSQLPPARDSGTARASGQPDMATARIGLISAIALFTIACLAATTLFSMLCGLAAAILGAMLVTRLAQSKIGGHTGDTIGATQQVVQTAALVGLVLAL